MRFKALIVSAFITLMFSPSSRAETNGGLNPSDIPMFPTNSGNNSSASNSNSDRQKLVASARKRVIINEMKVLKLNGTIMAEHADKTEPTALQTGSIVEKGDIVTVYGDSWVILKTHRGDQIGLNGNTVVTIDECYMEGPDRQVRLLLQKGTLLFHTNGDDSRQSFFEVNMGNVVASIDDLQAIFCYDPAKNFVDIKYIRGKIRVIDQTHSETFSMEQGEYNGYTRTQTNAGNNSEIPEEHSEHTWVNGKMAEEEPIHMEEIDEVNFKKFFSGEKPEIPGDNNIMLDDSQYVPYRQR
jgi:hypothetical protein